jgi:hypothetical protein
MKIAARISMMFSVAVVVSSGTIMRAQTVNLNGAFIKKSESFVSGCFRLQNCYLSYRIRPSSEILPGPYVISASAIAAHGR